MFGPPAAHIVQQGDTHPNCRFGSSQEFIEYLRQRCSEVAADVLVVLDRLEAQLPGGCQPAVLGHQDDHSFNVLCSKTDSEWQLEAAIDWESAAIVDPRLAYAREEPWSSLRSCGHVVKGRWLAAAIARAEAVGDWSAVPRCDLDPLRGEHNRASKRLVRKGMLEMHQPWASVFEQCVEKQK